MRMRTYWVGTLMVAGSLALAGCGKAPAAGPDRRRLGRGGAARRWARSAAIREWARWRAARRARRLAAYSPNAVSAGPSPVCD